MDLSFSSTITKDKVFAAVEDHLRSLCFTITARDKNRPWGGFYVIDEGEAEKFAGHYFPEVTKEKLMGIGKLSPKILIVAPEKRLSWQYHHRRAEIWKLIGGDAKLMTSDNDEETETTILETGNIVQLHQGRRHRLIGSENNWGIVAEIWQHTDAHNPSDEDDIVRVQDDFGR